MAPYSHADACAVSRASAPTGRQHKKLRRSESSSSSFSEADDPTTSNANAYVKIDRWQQLRTMVRTLTGLDDASDSPQSPRRRSPMLLLHHDFWLEALDASHRYGFHLRAFHHAWKQDLLLIGSCTDHRNRSFFFWLDYGRGSTLELPECNRMALDTTCVQYCSLQQRTQFQVEFSAAHELQFADSHAPVQTDSLSKWIFVLSLNDTLYIARKRKGCFHHSSFLAGVPITAAGKIHVMHGQIRAIEPHSGHFKPKLSSLLALCRVLHHHHVDTSAVQFIKPKKWSDPWPFTETMELSELEDRIDQGFISDSDES